MTEATLYKGEEWKFDPKNPERELAEFREHEERVKQVQAHLAAKSGGNARRVFHAKSHGCLLGELRLLSSRPDKTRHGIFWNSAPDKYSVLARFSNGKGTIDRDLFPDVRGVALKIFGAQSEPSARVLPHLAESNGSHGEGHTFRPGRQSDGDRRGRRQFRANPSSLIAGQVES